MFSSPMIARASGKSADTPHPKNTIHVELPPQNVGEALTSRFLNAYQHTELIGGAGRHEHPDYVYRDIL